ncbi:sterol desaturase family protein [Aquabacterium sp.]|uniref:sterol desaturase family protein n=1 Tax=Aquabacterium sp. TaxID=1872578 RepID=UPI002CB1B95C|nr:sterol desaturase family protein [Aquabacterium sp.]HSW05672.1 sterol desaturase family protein [Aquabacterium sp.]
MSAARQLFTLEPGRWAYKADMALYGAAVLALAALLLRAGPAGHAPVLSALVLTGLAAWTLIEYLVHRFVMHGLQPFIRWHQAHHHRPGALIFTPTWATAALIFALVFVPAWLALGLWPACALTLGVLTGYLAYGITHHATHHWRAGGAWLKQRKRWHARHHHQGQATCYGVTSGFWDRVFRSAAPSPRKVLVRPSPHSAANRTTVASVP